MPDETQFMPVIVDSWIAEAWKMLSKTWKCWEIL